MSKYCYANTVREFLTDNKENWLQIMKTSFSESLPFDLEDSQINAWKDSFDVLQRELPEFEKRHPGFSVIFEYQLPYESGRRPDVVLLSKEQVIIFEFKGKLYGEQADIDQCTAYARDIMNYHYESRDKDIQKAVVLTRATGKLVRNRYTKTPVISSDRISDYLEKVVSEKTTSTDIDAWANSVYEPLPTIVEAAKMFMNNERLPNIRRVQSTGIPKAINCLAELTRNAEANKEHIVAFVTGVPGAGKTFLGLQLVYDVCKDNSRVNSVYLSGNGPLVEVLTNALHSSVFVKDLHKVINEFLNHKAVDFNKNIIVFDEGQRAWDVEQMMAKKKSDTESEPDVMIRLCDERLDWCMLLILVGEGQEIYKGENSGIGQWNVALNNSNHDWKVFCPDKLVPTFAEQELIELDDNNILDLTVSLRTHLASDVSNFVNYLIEADIESARSLVRPMYEAGFSMVITRELDKAEQYCLARYSDDTDARYGLIASSKGSELQKHGVNNGFMGAVSFGRYGNWFNSSRGTGKSCCDFERPVTEFGIQGLELDMPIICWNSDFVWNGTSWDKYKKKEPANSDANVYRVNSYRVLLTRGRDGFVVFIPNSEKLDKVYELFKWLGIKEL